jgi:hypothetical protein
MPISEADAYGPAVVGLLLSGASQDGADGLASISGSGDDASVSGTSGRDRAARGVGRLLTIRQLSLPLTYEPSVPVGASGDVVFRAKTLGCRAKRGAML